MKQSFLIDDGTLGITLRLPLCPGLGSSVYKASVVNGQWGDN